MAELGIKLADGSFFPISEDTSPLRKRVILSTASEHQHQVNLTVLRRDAGQDAVVGTVVLDEIADGVDGAAELELVLGLDDDGNVDARLSDPVSGQYSSFAVNLAELPTEPDFGSFDAEDDLAFGGATLQPDDASDAANEDDEFGDLGFGESAEDEIDLDLELDEPFDPSADLAAVEHDQDAEDQTDDGAESDEGAGAVFDAGDELGLDDDFGLDDNLEAPGDLALDDNLDAPDDFTLDDEEPSLDDFSLDDLDGLDEPDAAPFTSAAPAAGLDSVDDFDSFGDDEALTDDESLEDFDLDAPSAQDELDDFSLDNADLDVDADLGSLDDDFDSDPDVSNTPIGGGFGGGMDFRSADESDSFGDAAEERKPAAKGRSARQSVDLGRPFRAVALLAVLLIGLSLIALATYGVFLLMVSEPVPVLRAVFPLVAWPRLRRNALGRFTQR